MAGVWNRDDLEALVAGASVSARDRNAQAVALSSLPVFVGQLDGHERLVHDPGWVLQLVHVHPDDRPRLVNMLVTQLLRVSEGEGWAQHQMQYLNLVHDPEVGAVLVVHRVLNPVAGDEVHSAPAPGAGDIRRGAPGAGELSAAGPGPSGDEPVRRFPSSTEAASCVAHLDVYGMIQRVDGPVEGLVGAAAEALVGEHVFHFVHPQDHSEALEVWLQLLREPGCSRTVRQRLVVPGRPDL